MIRILVVDPFGDVLQKEADSAFFHADEMVHYMFEDFFLKHSPFMEEESRKERYPYSKYLCKELGYMIIFEKGKIVGWIIPKEVSEEQLTFFERYPVDSKKQFVGIEWKNNSLFLIADIRNKKQSRLLVYHALEENYWNAKFALERKRRNNDTNEYKI